MNENEIKPVAWRFKDYLPVLAGGYAYGYTHGPQGPVCHDPLYARSAIDRLLAERDAVQRLLAIANDLVAYQTQIIQRLQVQP